MSRFSKDVNHCLSKHIVAKAKELRMIAMDDLQDISIQMHGYEIGSSSLQRVLAFFLDRGQGSFRREVAP